MVSGFNMAFDGELLTIKGRQRVMSISLRGVYGWIYGGELSKYFQQASKMTET